MAEPSPAPSQPWLESASIAPDFHPPADLAARQTMRASIRAQLWQLLGKLPPRPAVPAVKTLSRTEQPDFGIEKFEFDNSAGAMVPGYLLLPKKTGGKQPAILYCHWHGGDYPIGKEELFQKAHTPEEPGPALARKGFVVIGVDACCFGERSGQGPGGPREKGGAEELTASKFNLWIGRTLWGMIVRDDLMALDYLLSRPEVDTNRVGVTGISMGATRSWWLMALDERIQSGVAVACLTRYQDLIASRALSAHGIYYYVPGMLNHCDTEAVVSLIAPRPLLLMTGDQDQGSPVEGVRKIGQAVQKIYDLHGKSSAFENRIYEGVGHSYTKDMWERMNGWFDKHLAQ